MADSTESIGGVSVLIGGDYSPLLAQFQAAQGAAAAAGNAVASAFGAGAAGAPQLVDQFGRAVQSTVAPVEELAAAEGALTPAVETANAALTHQVSQLQATSGALRVLEGSGGIRAAERFLTMIPGVAAGAELLFPVVGAIALGEAISRIVSKSDDLKQGESELRQEVQKTDDAFAKMATTIDGLNVKQIGQEFGPAAAAQARANALASEARDAQKEIIGLQSKIDQLKKSAGGELQQRFNSSTLLPDLPEKTKLQIASIEEQIDQHLATVQGKYQEAAAALGESGLLGKEQSGQLQAARISNEESANAHLATMARQVAELQISEGHATAQARIDAMHDTGAAAIASAAEELRVAQEKEASITALMASELPKRIALIRQHGAAESAGKSAPDQANIGSLTSGQVADAEADAAQQAFTLHADVVARQGALDEAQATQGRKVAAELATSWRESYDAITKAAKETSDAQAKATELVISTRTRVMEIEAKGKGQANAGAIEANKLAAERAYGQEVLHTGAQQVAFARELADYDSKARAAKLAGLQDDLKVAEAATGTLRDETRIATLKQEVASLTQQNNNADYAAQTKILGLIQQQSLARQLGATAQRIPGAIGNAAAAGVINGKGIGQDIHNALKGIGQEMLGSIFTKLVSTILVQTGVQAAFNAIFPIASTAQVVATTANTAALGFLTAAVLTQMALLGFADGGSPPVGVPSMVGERGPELFIPHQSGVIVPNHALKGYASGAGNWQSAVSGASSSAFSMGDMHVHLHGNQGGRQVVDHVMRELPKALKARSSKFAAYSS